MSNASFKRRFLPRLEVLEDRTVPVARTWTNGGLDGLWSNPENWSGQQVPGITDEARFLTTNNVDCTVDGSYTVDKLTIAAGYTATISIEQNGGLSVSTSGEMRNGTLQGGSLALLDGCEFDYYGGAIQTEVYVAPEALVTILASDVDKQISGEVGKIQNYGYVLWATDTTDTLVLQDSGHIYNFAGSQFDFGDRIGEYHVTGNGTFENSGGTVKVDGNTTIEDSVSFIATGIFSISATRTLELEVPYSYVIDATFQTAANSTLLYDLPGGTNSIDGMVINGQGKLHVTSDDQATLTLNGGLTNNVAYLQTGDPIIAGDGAFVLTGASDIQGGKWQGNGAATIGAAGVANFNSAFEIHAGRYLDNYGEAHVNNVEIEFGLGNGSYALINYGSLFLHGASTLAFDNSGEPVQVLNYGYVEADGTTPSVDFVVVNYGGIKIAAGELTVDGISQYGGYTKINDRTLTSPFVQIYGGTFYGPGTLFGSLSNFGGLVTFDQRGELLVTGDFYQGSGGTTRLLIAGSDYLEFDQIGISGAGHLGGTLEVEWTNNFEPDPEDVFDLFGFWFWDESEFDTIFADPNWTVVYDEGGVQYMLGS